MARRITGLLMVLAGAACMSAFLAQPRFQQSPDSTAPSLSARNGPDTLREVIYQASRQEDSEDSLRHLAQATELLMQGADVNAKGAQGRTALHWAVIGAMYAEKQKHRQAYLELTELLISHGAAVNAEDDYGNTPLDWQEVSPHDAILPLLLEQGARNGVGNDETERLSYFLETLSAADRAGDLSKIRAALATDLPAGAELQIRLTTEVGSHHSRAGDPVEAVLIAPVMVGERAVVGPGTRIQGTVMLAQTASDDYRRAQLILDFPNLVHPSGAKTRLATRLAAVDNAKEIVQAGRIIGLAHPDHTKLTWAMRPLGVASPLLSYAFQATMFLRDREYKREISYEPGVEMTLTVLAPAKLADVAEGQAWPPLMSPSAQLTELVRAQPLQTATPHKVPSDLTNLMLIGAGEKIEAALQAGGWVEAEKLGLTSGLKAFGAVVESKGFKGAPASLLLLDGQKPDLVYQKQNDTFAKRHHIRIWKRPQSYQGQEVWLAAATHDVGIAVHREGTQWIHRIDSKIDRERTKVVDDLLFTGMAKGHALIDRPAAPRESMNATGDRLETDGKMAVLVLALSPDH